MRIAICNGNGDLVKILKRMMYTYAEIKRIEITVDCYLCGEKLLSSGKKYEIIFLGGELSGINGIKTAELIRKKDKLCAIILSGPDQKYVLEAFKVKAFRYLIEPVKQSEVFCVLDEYFEDGGKNRTLLIKSGIDTICINTDEIVYVEADNKHCYVHLCDESHRCNWTMARVYNSLPKNLFLKINRAFVVNVDFVNRYNNQDVYLKNGQQLHIGRTYLRDFKISYCNNMLPFQP